MVLRPLAIGLAGAALVIALVVATGGTRLVWSDEVVYAAAARELAAERPPLAFDTNAHFIHRFGFPHVEPHARGGVFVLARLFQLLGAREAVALIPSIAWTLGSAAVAYAVIARSRGPWAAAAGTVVVVAAPTVAGFAGTAFHEPAITFAYLVAAASVVAEGRAAPALLALSAFVGVAHRETAALLPLVAAAAIAHRERRVAPAGLALAAGLASAGLALLLARGAFSRHADATTLPWYVAQPLLSDTAYREGFGVASDASPPAITLALLASRAARRLPELLWCSRPIAGAGLALVFVHATALAAVATIRRSSDRAVRALAAFALILQAAKLAFLLLVYEEPGLNARHFAPESAVLLLAVLAGASRPVIALVAAPLLALDLHVAHARHVERERLERYAATLERVANVTAPGALVAYNAHLTTWDRPGTFTILPPASVATLEWLAGHAELQAAVLDATEPLLAEALLREGRIPRRLGPLTITGTDRSLGVTLVIYERAR